MGKYNIYKTTNKRYGIRYIEVNDRYPIVIYNM